ncbi:signal transducer and activator of transcription 1-like [Danio aesculapii]|uniref:signal transducer and activator of transcription 1-like n=1 Tax=Danio aesculapii TaxID=1142201 RepID=UPI0024BFC50A|nr:signal transducer and activator of transcription 1-like [Danio aesculapii]
MKDSESETKCQRPKEMKLEEAEQMFTGGLNIKREVVMKDIANALTLAEQIQFTLITEELPEWKKRQQMACIGGPHNTCLDQLQNWFTVVAECLQQIRQQLKKVQELVQKFTYCNDPLNLGWGRLDEQAISLFKNLILNSLVVERQPCMPWYPQRPLLIKTLVQFTVKIRLLVKLPELNCQPKANVSVDKGFSELDTVKGIAFKVPFFFPQPPFPLCDELHLICFHTQLVLPDLCIDLSITSLPVSIMTPFSRSISYAWGSVLWYNMLSSEPHNLTFFLNPPPVKWHQLSKVISWQFSSVTKRALTSDQLRTLADKLLGHKAQGDPEELVQHSTFCKAAVEQDGSLWNWMYEHLELVKNLVLNIWNDGYIMGFLSQERAEALLIDKAPGTFLLRFSESCRDGGIIITWVESRQDGERVVHSTEPYNKTKIYPICLPKIIRDFTTGEKDPVNPLIYLYPDIPRDLAFGRYYTSESEDLEGMNKYPSQYSLISVKPTG